MSASNNTIKKIVTTFLILYLFFTIVYALFDFSLFPALFYSSTNFFTMLQLLLLATFFRAIFYTIVYQKIITPRNTKSFVTSLLLSSLPIQFTESILMVALGIVKPIDVAGLNQKFIEISVTMKLSFAILSFLENLSKSVPVAFIIYMLVAALLFEASRFFAVVLLLKFYERKFWGRKSTDPTAECSSKSSALTGVAVIVEQIDVVKWAKR